MSVGSICSRNVVFTTERRTARDAAELMRRHQVGDLVVVERTEAGDLEPIGILTDRDLVVDVMARGGDPDQTLVASVMTRRLVTALEDEVPTDVLERMRASGVRRVPVVDAGGELVGIITYDDLVEWLSEQLETLASVVAEGTRRERARP